MSGQQQMFNIYNDKNKKKRIYNKIQTDEGKTTTMKN